MIVVRFPNGQDWAKANWVFRQFVEDVALNTDDQAILYSLREGVAIGTLFLNKMSIDFSAKTLRVMEEIAERTASGEISGWKSVHPDDVSGARMYHDAIAELLVLVREAQRETST